MINSQDMASQAEAWGKQYNAEQAKEQQPKQKPGPFDVFAAEVPDGPVPDSLFHAAVIAADKMSRSDGPRYREVRDLAMYFFAEGRHGALENAAARLCIPLLGLTRMLDHVHASAVNGSDDGMDLRFADVHSAQQHVQRYLLDALHVAGRGLFHEFVNFIARSASEDQLDAAIRRDVHNSTVATLLTLAASVLKDGQAVHGALEQGARSTDDLPTGADIALRPRTSAHGHGVHLFTAGDGSLRPLHPSFDAPDNDATT